MNCSKFMGGVEWVPRGLKKKLTLRSKLACARVFHGPLNGIVSDLLGKKYHIKS